MQIVQLSIPDYNVDKEPDYESIGERIDEVLKEHFMNKRILLRGIGSVEHPCKSIDDLVEIVKTTGTDHYDPTRRGDRYENVENKQIDLFAFSGTVTTTLELGGQVIYGFYHSAIGVHGHPTKIDILIVYDADQFDQVLHRYEGRSDVKHDGFVFKNQSNKEKAVLGIIKLL